MKYRLFPPKTTLERYEKLERRASWDDVQRLAEEYVQIKTQTGAGTTLENRDARQKTIVDEVLGSTLSYFILLAKELMYGQKNKNDPSFSGRPIQFQGKSIRVSRESSIDDLVQEGVLRILQKFPEYNPGRGRISTWIYMWALESMFKSAESHGYVLKAPIHLRREIKWLSGHNKEEIVQGVAFMPTSGYNNNLGNISARLIYLSVKGDYEEITDDTPIPEETNPLNGRAKEEHLPIDQLIQIERREALYNALAFLTPKQQRVLTLRYGLNGSDSHTQGRIGQEMRVTSTRIGQIEGKAIRRLAHPAQGLLQFLD